MCATLDAEVRGEYGSEASLGLGVMMSVDASVWLSDDNELKRMKKRDDTHGVGKFIGVGVVGGGHERRCSDGS
jgi:hypothetical protein